MSSTSPAGKSFQPLAQSASRVGSYCLVQLTTRTVSYCPQLSLNTTHSTIDGALKCVSIRAFNSCSNCRDDSAEREISFSFLLGPASPLGMSCQTTIPSLSHQ